MNKPKAKPTKQNITGLKSSTHKSKTPSLQEMNALMGFFNYGLYADAANLAQTMTVQFPHHGFGWSILGAALKQMGRSADALAPMQKAATLAPGNAEMQYNLGLILHDLGRLDE